MDDNNFAKQYEKNYKEKKDLKIEYKALIILLTRIIKNEKEIHEEQEKLSWWRFIKRWRAWHSTEVYSTLVIIRDTIIWKRLREIDLQITKKIQTAEESKKQNELFEAKMNKLLGDMVSSDRQKVKDTLKEIKES